MIKTTGEQLNQTPILHDDNPSYMASYYHKSQSSLNQGDSQGRRRGVGMGERAGRASMELRPPKDDVGLDEE